VVPPAPGAPARRVSSTRVWYAGAAIWEVVRGRSVRKEHRRGCEKGRGVVVCASQQMLGVQGPWRARLPERGATALPRTRSRRQHSTLTTKRGV
jgi:hypothetical protein